MNSFYNTWNSNIHEIEYIDAFLNKKPTSTVGFCEKDDDLQKMIVDTLFDVNPDELIERIIRCDTEFQISTSQVPQFSSYEVGTRKICEILAFFPEGLTYKDLGFQLCKAGSEGACVKYGENHAKLAHILQLVEFLGTRGTRVRISPFGKEILRITDGKENKIFQKLLLRENVIKQIIREGSENKVSYRQVVCALSDITATRRRTNTKCILKNALLNTSYEYIYDNVIW